MQNQMISVLNNFSPNPSGRYYSDGPNSGQRFREECLLPALKVPGEVTVKLDVTLGYGSSFLEEAFGGLVRAGFKFSDLKKRLHVLSDVSMYQNRVWKYIQEESVRQYGA